MSADLEIVPARRRGRPSLYNAAYCDRVLELAAEGCSKAEIAAALQVTAKTLPAWTKAHDEFRDAMGRAKEIEYAWWLAAGRKGQFMRTWNASGWVLNPLPPTLVPFEFEIPSPPILTFRFFSKDFGTA